MANVTTDLLDLRCRTQTLIEYLAPPERRFKDLEELTGIPAGTWRSFWNRGDVPPSGAMLHALSTQAPDYALWLLTGSVSRRTSQVGMRRRSQRR